MSHPGYPYGRCDACGFGLRADGDCQNPDCTRFTPRVTPEPTLTFQATFTPQAWFRDYAIDVDPEGPTSWDCTAMVQRHWEGYFSRKDFDGYFEDLPVLDTDDVLKGDPAAPEWVREWRGPFSIFVTRNDLGDSG